MTLAAGYSYYDESGKFHNHDPNTFSQGWQCSNGHHGTVHSRLPWYCCGKPGMTDVQTSLVKTPSQSVSFGSAVVLR